MIRGGSPDGNMGGMRSGETRLLQENKSGPRGERRGLASKSPLARSCQRYPLTTSYRSTGIRYMVGPHSPSLTYPASRLKLTSQAPPRVPSLTDHGATEPRSSKSVPRLCQQLPDTLSRRRSSRLPYVLQSQPTRCQGGVRAARRRLTLSLLSTCRSRSCWVHSLEREGFVE